jgi:dienelactone hydrolase
VRTGSSQTTLDQKGFCKDDRPIRIGEEIRNLELYVKGQQEPPLILLHELPGLTQETFELGDYFAAQHFRVVMPLLFGRAGERKLVTNTLRVCLQDELRQLYLGKDGAIVEMIRALANEELARHRQQSGTAAGVAVVGMCFTGSMVLALLLHEGDQPSPVAAPVMAQPSSGYSAVALAAARQGQIKGPVLALRFEKDWICQAQGQGMIVHELEGKGHSTLVYHYDLSTKRRDLRSPSGETIDVREAVTRFIRSQVHT